MASYTDKITTFNPYISQLPLIEEMSKVGMEKQQQYNQGVQKIQSQIDNVAGLDIGRDTDKKYLQSKLDELGNNLKTVAAGDFSNFQLVNSVGGMANQIGKDAYIQAAVYSTANDKKQLSDMEADKKKGTLTPHAKLYYELQRSKYFNNPNLKGEDGKPITFSGQYTPSWDLDKHMLEAVNAVGDASWTAENVFKMDPTTGKPLRNIESVKNPRTGKMEQIDRGPVYSEYAIEAKRAGKFNENITGAINSVLDRPEAKQELAMRGIYNYRGYDNVNDFVSLYKAEKDKGVSLWGDRRIELQSKLTTETDPEKKKDFQNQILQVDNNIAALKNNEDAKMAEALKYNNVDAYKAALETQRVTNDYLKGYVTEKLSEKYIKNIPSEAHAEIVKTARDWWATQTRIGLETANYELHKITTGIAKEKWTYDKDNPNNPNIASKTPFEGGAKELGAYVGNIMTEGSNLVSEYDKTKTDFVLGYLGSINPSSTAEDNQKLLAQGIASDPNYLTTMFEKGYKDVETHPEANKFSNLRTAFPKIADIQKRLEANSNTIQNMNNDPEVKASGANLDFGKMAEGLKSFDITRNINGRNVTQKVTPQDLLNANIIAHRSDAFTTDAEKGLYQGAKKQLDEKFGANTNYLFDLGFIPKIDEGFSVAAGVGVSGEYEANPRYLKQHGFDDATIAKMANVGNQIKDGQFLSSLTARENYLKRVEMGNSPLSYKIYPNDAKSTEITSIDQNVKAFLSTRKAGGINVSPFEKAYSGKETDKYNLVVQLDRGTPNEHKENWSLDLYDGDKKVATTPATRTEAESMMQGKIDVPQYVSLAQQYFNTNGSTNKTYGPANMYNPDAYSRAILRSSDFNNLRRTDLFGADVIRNQAGVPNLYFYIRDASGNIEPIPFKRQRGDREPVPFSSVDAAEKFAKDLNASGKSAMVDEIINNNK